MLRGETGDIFWFIAEGYGGGREASCAIFGGGEAASRGLGEGRRALGRDSGRKPLCPRGKPDKEVHRQQVGPRAAVRPLYSRVTVR